MGGRAGFFEVEILDWKTKKQLCFLDKVFLIEYTGPLFIYFLFYFRMTFVYGLDERFTSSPHPVVNLACICHSFHYIKRLIETVFVHRFSRGTMPLRKIVKLCEAGNFSIHVALSDLRRNGSKTRKIPYPTKNPFTWLFFFVSCPNYTYEDKVILINRDINANAVTRNILNFLGQNSGAVYLALLHSDDNLGKG
ncbi:very-long-chain enoyl-CoA reductase isoform X2 [Pitangus sulphuratus]|nr:very-long-chain enoyl-CoA reductase isoform X2 [Pitangus sulphuratus]